MTLQLTARCTAEHLRSFDIDDPEVREAIGIMRSIGMPNGREKGRRDHFRDHRAGFKFPEPLYCSEEQVAAAVLGPGRLREWRDRAAILERDGLPKIDALMGGRYWPAVRKFFDRRNGLLDGLAAVPQTPDGGENFRCPKPRQKLKPNKAPPVSTGETGKAANVFHIGSPLEKQ